TRSGGSRGASMPVRINLAALRDNAINKLLMLDARGGLGWQHTTWGIPSATIISWTIQHSLIGAAPARWFYQIDPTAPGLEPRFRWGSRVVRLAGLLAGLRLPSPLYVPFDHPLPIVRWMAEVLRSG